MSARAMTMLRNRYGIAVAAGLLLAAAFPTPGIAGLAWIAPGLMAGAALGKSPGEAFRIGYAGGLAHFLASLYWLLHIPYRWHGVPLGPAAGWLALSAFLALYPAAWLWLLSHWRPETRETGGLLARSWIARQAWILAAAAAWVALEFGRGRILGGFPWNFVGVSQWRMTPLIQLAGFTGVYGVSFVVVWLSLSLAGATLAIVRRPSSRSAWLPEVFIPVLTVAVLFNVGLRRLHHTPDSPETVRMTLLQPSIPQTLIWDQKADDDRFRELLNLTETALTNRADIVIWPEAAIPKLLRWDKPTFQAVTDLARRHRAWMIIGSDDAEPRRDSPDRNAADYFNSSFLISPEGELVSRYVKRNLVIFGEFVPLSDWLPVFKMFTPIQGGFTPGKAPVQFSMGSLGVTASVLICFEDSFPHLARAAARPGTDFLLNLTNDGWFENSAAQWQHLTTALFRAVENGRPLIRCCNNGVTCWIDSRGRLRDVFRDPTGSVYGRGSLTIDVPRLSPDDASRPTFYNRRGDAFAWTCVGLTALWLARRLLRLRRGSPLKGKT